MKSWIFLPVLIMLGCSSANYSLPRQNRQFNQFPDDFNLHKKISYEIEVSYGEQQGRLKDDAKLMRKAMYQNAATIGFLLALNLPGFDVDTYDRGRTFAMNSFTRNSPATSPCGLIKDIKEGEVLPKFKEIDVICNFKYDLRNGTVNRLSGIKKYISKNEFGILKGGNSSLIELKPSTFSLSRSFDHYEYGREKKGNKHTQSVFEFRQGRGLSFSTLVLWRAPDFYDIKERKGIHGAEFGLKIKSLATTREKDVVIPNLDFVFYFDNHIPQISPQDYTFLLKRIYEEMSKYYIESYLAAADYNSFSYYRFKSYLFSDDASGMVKFQTPSYRVLRNTDSLRELWGIILLGFTKTSFERSKDKKKAYIKYEIDLPKALKFAKAVSRKEFYE